MTDLFLFAVWKMEVLEWITYGLHGTSTIIGQIGTGTGQSQPGSGGSPGKKRCYHRPGLYPTARRRPCGNRGLKQAGREARGAALYVTLEPCCHHGRTPPCTNALISAGITEVHFPIVDPNPRVAGKGQAELQKAGIKIYVGEHAEEATILNEAFIKYITTGLPFVTVKFASSLDGKIATRSGDSKWISGEAARKLVQHMRYEADAVMTGAGTIIADDPQLTVRIAVRGGITHKQPLRIIVDGRGRTPTSSRLFSEPGQHPTGPGR